MKRWPIFLSACVTSILLAMPISSAEAFWGWGGFGFSFGTGYYGSGWHRHHWYRPWSNYHYPYRWRRWLRRYGYYPFYGYPLINQPLVSEPSETEPATAVEK